MNKIYSSILYILMCVSCVSHQDKKTFSLSEGLKEIVSIKGKPDNKNYLYVTAGTRLYSIGNQQGNFPEIGFHVPGEMGGIWQHPIKLLDGFELSVNNHLLEECDQFIAYPFANQFIYKNKIQGVNIIRTDFVPDSLPVFVVEYTIDNLTDDTQQLELTFKVHSDLSPVWLGERCGMNDTQDILQGINAQNICIIKDSLNCWFAGISSEETLILSEPSQNQFKGQGICTNFQPLIQQIPSGTKKTLRFYIAGSNSNKTEVEQNLQFCIQNVERLFNEKKQRYHQIDKRAHITIPDTLLAQAYQWGKYNNDWLIREVPEMGRGMNAGLPDYPWFFSNDQGATFSALVGTIDPQIFYDSWEMLLRISNKANDNSGRIIHEVSTNGEVYDKGRMEEAQTFINTAWTIFKWTGNKDFLKTYYEHGKKVWTFLQAHDTNHNLYVEGYGGVEIEGLNDEMLDVAVATQVFLQNMSQMALIFDESELSQIYASKAQTLKVKINEDWWSPREHRYHDFLADKKKAIELIDMALEKRVNEKRNKWAKEKLITLKKQIQNGEYDEKGYTVFYNSPSGVLNEGIADKEKAIAVLENMSFFTNKYGLYISGIARPDDISLEEGSVAFRLKDNFNYHEAIMTIGTSGLAIAECKFRGSDYAMKYIHQILNNFSFATPGTTYEVCPDYGMFCQAWNVSGLNIPLIQYIFGVDPMAYSKTITLNPDIPSDWEFAKLERLLIGNNELSIDFNKRKNKHFFTINNTQADWMIDFHFPSHIQTAKVNGRIVTIQQNKILLKETTNTIEY